MVHTFDKKAFKKQIKENVKLLYRKEFEEANDQEVYQAVALAVKDEVLDQLAGDPEDHGEKGSKDRILYVYGILNGPGIGKQYAQSLLL